MCLVLGRPGSGCTTFLRTISGYDEGFDKVEGDVRFGNFGMKEMKRFYRGEVAFNGESGRWVCDSGEFFTTAR
jgi:ABC-type multidrug transport system ATPase subunit